MEFGYYCKYFGSKKLQKITYTDTNLLAWSGEFVIYKITGIFTLNAFYSNLPITVLVLAHVDAGVLIINGILILIDSGPFFINGTVSISTLDGSRGVRGSGGFVDQGEGSGVWADVRGHSDDGEGEGGNEGL